MYLKCHFKTKDIAEKKTSRMAKMKPQFADLWFMTLKNMFDLQHRKETYNILNKSQNRKTKIDIKL